MRDKFELFRLSLLLRKQRDAFSGEDPTRENYLRAIFYDRWAFKSRGVEYHYVPEPQQPRDDVIIGRIGRAWLIDENLPPDKNLVETTHEGWKAIDVLIDPREHQDGQKVAMGVDKTVGSPSSLISALVDHINSKLPHTAWAVDVEPIMAPSTFWEFADRHKGEITLLTFEFVTPNMFGGTDNLSEELRAFRQREKAEKVTLQLKSAEGLDTDTDKTREGVDYAVKGCGKIRAKTRTGRRFNSADKAATVVIDEPDEETKGSRLARLARLARRILGHE